MQCANCGFENVPGQPVCGRCQSRLNLVDVPVEPIRRHQRRWTVRLRGRLANRWARMEAAFEQLLSPRVVQAAVNGWHWLARLLIPGGGQFSRGARARGWIFLGLWLAALVWCLLDMGGSAWPLGMLVSIHAASVIDAVVSGSPGGLRPRLVLGVVVYVVVLVLVYLPAVWVITGFVRPVPVGGQVLLVTGRWLGDWSARPGDVVLYHSERQAAGHLRAAAGEGVDRIIAGPGQLVEISEGAVRVDGLELGPNRQPLEAIPTDLTLQVEVSPGCYAIVPSTWNWRHWGNLVERETWQQLVARAIMVQKDHVDGKVIWRVRPWSQFGPME